MWTFEVLSARKGQVCQTVNCSPAHKYREKEWKKWKEEVKERMTPDKDYHLCLVNVICFYPSIVARQVKFTASNHIWNKPLDWGDSLMLCLQHSRVWQTNEMANVLHKQLTVPNDPISWKRGLKMLGFARKRCTNNPSPAEAVCKSKSTFLVHTTGISAIPQVYGSLSWPVGAWQKATGLLSFFSFFSNSSCPASKWQLTGWDVIGLKWGQQEAFI